MFLEIFRNENNYFDIILLVWPCKSIDYNIVLAQLANNESIFIICSQWTLSSEPREYVEQSEG